jgi:hypothetical protein
MLINLNTKLMKKIILYLLCFFFSNTFSQSIQHEVISSGGGEYKQLNASLQFNFGEVIVEDYQNSSCHLQQGFEQGYLGLVNLQEIKNKQVVKIYPNPTIDVFFLEINDSKNNKLELIDLTGKILRSYSFNNQIEISLNEFSIGMYLLKLYPENNNNCQTFQIIKYE